MNTVTKTVTNPIRRAFTLIEILIVVVILGILAAIVVPQFTNAADEANEAAVKSMLQTLRGQIELYYAQNAAYPDLLGTDAWEDLIDNDYILAAPVNPYTGESDVNATNGASQGWTWAVKDGPSTAMVLTAVNAAGGAFVE